MHQNTALEIAAAPRTHVFSVLTLDVVRPFYDMMGLRPGDPSGFQKVLREATIAARKQVERAAVAGGPPPTLTDFCQYVEGAIGLSATEHLVWWLQNVFHSDPRDNLDLNHWDDALRYCRHESERWLRLGFPKELSEEILNRFRMAINVEAFYRRQEEGEAHPLSDWDLHMYASQTYDFDDDEEGAWPSPFVWVLATIRDYQGYVFWAWVLRTLSSHQLTRLREAALRVVQEEELTSVKDLIDPTRLGIGL